MKRKQLFVLGDSISIDYTPYVRQYLNSDWNVTRKGDIPAPEISGEIDRYNGTDSRIVLAYLQAVIHAIESQVLLLNCGLHDIKRQPADSEPCQISEADYRGNLKSIIDLILVEQKKVIWVSTTPVDPVQHRKVEKTFFRFNEDVIQYNKIADEIMTQYKIMTIDLFTFTAQINQPLYRDHVHFYPEISKLQGAYLSGAIASLF